MTNYVAKLNELAALLARINDTSDPQFEAAWILLYEIATTDPKAMEQMFANTWQKVLRQLGQDSLEVTWPDGETQTIRKHDA